MVGSPNNIQVRRTSRSLVASFAFRESRLDRRRSGKDLPGKAQRSRGLLIGDVSAEDAQTPIAPPFSFSLAPRPD